MWAWVGSIQSCGAGSSCTPPSRSSIDNTTLVYYFEFIPIDGCFLVPRTRSSTRSRLHSLIQEISSRFDFVQLDFQLASVLHTRSRQTHSEGRVS